MDQNERERMKLVAVCREVDRDTGRIAVYPLKMEMTGDTVRALQVRARVNTELRYFTMTAGRWEKYGTAITGILKRRTVTGSDVDRIGGIVEL